MGIRERYIKFRKEIPENVAIVLAAKTRTEQEISEAIAAGATDVGENYVQETQAVLEELGAGVKKVRWHLIGPLQKNKINQALPIFDVIQTVGDYKIAEHIDKRAEKSGKKIIPIYIEINIAEEKSKYGMVPEYKTIFKLIKKISSNLSHIRIEGLMTMGPEVEDKQSLRPYFRKAKKIFESLKTAKLPNVEMKVLSMGMSDSYQIAIEEGSNMIRIGTAIFGKREKYIF